MKNESSILILEGPFVGSGIIFGQIEKMLKQFNVADYIRPIDILSDASIGEHIRHIIDFYTCIINGSDTNHISYDKRKRKKEIEIDPQFAISCIGIILLEMELIDVQQGVTIETKFSTDKNEIPSILKSTFGRELMYAMDHAIHHLALVKIGVNDSFNNIQLDHQMGIAPSTFRFRKS